MTDLEPSTPIRVSRHAWQDALPQALRYGLSLGAGVVFNHFVESEVLTGAFVAMVGFLAVYGWGLVTTISAHRKMKDMANLLPDRDAVLK